MNIKETPTLEELQQKLKVERESYSQLDINDPLFKYEQNKTWFAISMITDDIMRAKFDKLNNNND